MFQIVLGFVAFVACMLKCFVLPSVNAVEAESDLASGETQSAQVVRGGFRAFGFTEWAYFVIGLLFLTGSIFGMIDRWM